MRRTIRFIDLFCGIGGIRLAAEGACAERGCASECVLSCDIDPNARNVYRANFDEIPQGDITLVDENDVSDHDILLAGFPCQPFSICGSQRGFADTRGTMFFHLARILAAKKPPAFVLENVKMLARHDNGRTLRVILDTLADAGYQTHFRVLNALDFGLPQRRYRIFIVGFLDPVRFRWPCAHVPMTPLEDILEPIVPAMYYASDRIKIDRAEKVNFKDVIKGPTIWHSNKSGSVSAYPYACSQRAGASYNYLLVNGERRLTEREMLRLNGFPETFKIVSSYSATKKQAGNSVAVPCVKAVIGATLDALFGCDWNEALPDLYGPQESFNF
jgi:DNA (cytosine-5)-methyltransferase 1